MAFGGIGAAAEEEATFGLGALVVPPPTFKDANNAAVADAVSMGAGDASCAGATAGVVVVVVVVAVVVG